MNDLEICKRIAELEKIPHHISRCKNHVMIQDKSTPALRWVRYVEYSPLKDDALCFQLMIKHGVDLVNRKDYYEVMFVRLKDSPLENWDSVEEENPNKAICLAIIEANKNE